MARAATATPSTAKHWRAHGFRWSDPGVSGHARLLAHPAYRRLLAAEPFLRRLIPVLIVVFLVIVGFARFLVLYEQKLETSDSARRELSLVAAAVSGSGQSSRSSQNAASAVSSGAAR